MLIRSMDNNDYERVYKLWMSCKGMGLNDLDDSKEGIDRFLKRNPDTCFVAEQNGKIIGSIICGNDGRRGYIYHTAVASNYRKKGVGTVLVETTLQALKNLGINKAALVVFSKTPKEMHFGKSLVLQ